MAAAETRGRPIGAGWPMIDAAIRELRAGRPIVLLDDAERENEGDLVIAAQFATPEWIAFFIREARGLVCVALEPERLDALEIHPMAARNTSPQGTGFAVSVDAVDVSTGVSAADRAATVRALIDPVTTPDDLLRPGHVFPLRAAEGGLNERRGHTEAAIELCRRAGLFPAAVIAEVMNPDGTMARPPELAAFAGSHGFSLLTIEALAGRTDGARVSRAAPPRVAHPPAARRAAETSLPTRHGRFQLLVYERGEGCNNDVALVLGEPRDETALVRIHSECFTGDVLGSLRCDCGEQLESALAAIAAAGGGVLVYLRQEGRGIGLVNKARAYALQDGGLDTVDANLALGFPADLRTYTRAAAILADLGIARVRLLTNNPAKVEGLERAGISVRERIPLQVSPGPLNLRYLATKRDRLGHQLELP